MPVFDNKNVPILVSSAKYTVHIYNLPFECMLINYSLLCDGPGPMLSVSEVLVMCIMPVDFGNV